MSHQTISAQCPHQPCASLNPCPESGRTLRVPRRLDGFQVPVQGGWIWVYVRVPGVKFEVESADYWKFKVNWLIS